MKSQQITVKRWAGFAEGKLDCGWLENEGYRDTTHGIYKTKKEAKKHYEDVRKIMITYPTS